MNIEAVEHILRRCVTLLQRDSGTYKTKQEYHYWISWLKKELKNYNKLNSDIKNNIKTLILKNKYLHEDLNIKL
jgi:hypothetical protein